MRRGKLRPTLGGKVRARLIQDPLHSWSAFLQLGDRIAIKGRPHENAHVQVAEFLALRVQLARCSQLDAPIGEMLQCGGQ